MVKTIALGKICISTLLINFCLTSGGSQFKVAVNDIVMVNKLPAKVGSEIKLEKVRKPRRSVVHVI